MKPLENIKVLDLTRVLAGPFCTMILSDLGAEVVKVEMPGTGDDSRAFGPFKNGKSLYFLSINREKKSISLNLKSEKGKEILKDLVKEFDVLVENFKPGTMEKLGLGWDVLKEINPKLIYAASSGFGHTGPDSKKPAYDILAQAMGGIMSITGWPGSEPTRVGMSLGDITASLFTAIGVNAAIYQRTITGEGQKIDVSMLDGQLAILENALARYQVDGKSPEPLGNRHPGITPFQALKASDGYIIIAAGNDKLYRSLCDAIERPELADHPDYVSNELRTKNVHALAEELNKVLANKTVNEWLTIIENANVPVCPINDIGMAMEHPQVLSRNMIVEVEDKDIGKLKIAGNPIKMTSVPEKDFRGPAPEVGEHNYEVLKQYLDLNPNVVDQLKKDGVI
jgi:CoA:oxalate CoA-transferase